MKSPETHPLAPAEEVTPPPVGRASDPIPDSNPDPVDDARGGSGHVPIAVSDGDFSTPTKRKRTITRPRGLRTLEQLANTPQALPTVEILTASADTSMTETPPVATGILPGHEASVVDEFLATPPTPAPEVEVTPPSEPLPVPASNAASAADGEGDRIERPGTAPDLGPEALADLARERDTGMRQDQQDQQDQRTLQTLQDQLAADLTPAIGEAPSDLDQTNVDDLLEQASAHLSPAVDVRTPSVEPAAIEWRITHARSEVPLVVSIAEALAQPSLEAQQGAQPASSEQASEIVRPFGSVVAPNPVREDALVIVGEDVSVLAGADTGVTASEDISVGAGEVGGLPAAPPMPEGAVMAEGPAMTEYAATAEAELSPLAQTLAHMAEAMHADVPIESALDIEIVDGPLVPMPPEVATSARTATPPPHPVSPPRFPALGTEAGGSAERPLLVPPFVGLPEALAERPRRPKRSKPWFEEVFDESYLRTLPFMTAEQTLREVDFIESSLGVPKGEEVLDIGCGYGRHAIELVQRGLAVTGLDLSLPLLIRAADESQRRSVSVNFVHTDMREMAFERQFAGAYCMLTSFGYFDEESNLKVAEGIARALKPGGRFLIDVINRDYIVGDLPARVWWEGDGCVVLEEVDFNFNTNRILTHRSVVFDDGQQLEQEISVRVYSLHEMGKLLRQAGFRVIEVSGSIPTRGHFFGANSRNLLILAERRPE